MIDRSHIRRRDRFRARQIGVASCAVVIMIVMVRPPVTLANTGYSQDVYGSGVYGGAASLPAPESPVTSTTPVAPGRDAQPPGALPATGAVIFGLIAIGGLTTASGLFLWARQRRQQRVAA
jgi:LPXTG-motif cell wall-anchored protein